MIAGDRSNRFYWAIEDTCVVRLRARTSQEAVVNPLPGTGVANSVSFAPAPPAAKLFAKFFCSCRQAEVHNSFTSFIITPILSGLAHR